VGLPIIARHASPIADSPNRANPISAKVVMAIVAPSQGLRAISLRRGPNRKIPQKWFAVNTP